MSAGTDTMRTRDTVALTLPADSAYLSVLRTATAGLAARLDFTLDEIEDLRIAVDEACAMLLADCLPGSELRATFDLAEDAIDIRIAVPSEHGRLPGKDTFAWTVLCALAGEVDSETRDDGTTSIRLLKHRSTTA